MTFCLTFVGACALVDLAGVGDVAVATVAVVQHALGIVLRLTDEETFGVGVDDERGRRLACARRIEDDAERCFLRVTRGNGHGDQQNLKSLETFPAEDIKRTTEPPTELRLPTATKRGSRGLSRVSGHPPFD